MKNIEKLKELKDYELSQIIILLNISVEEQQQSTGANDNLDAFDLMENGINIIVEWLNEEYDEAKGFKLAIERFAVDRDQKELYLDSKQLQAFDYLSEED